MCCVKGKSLCIYLSKFREMVEDHPIEEVSSHQTTTNQTHFIWYNYSVALHIQRTVLHTFIQIQSLTALYLGN